MSPHVEKAASTVDVRRQADRRELPGIESALANGRCAVTADANQVACKVVLLTPNTASTSLLSVNLTAVAVGTLKVLVWVAVIGLAIIGGLIGGMIKASARRRPRYR